MPAQTQRKPPRLVQRLHVGDGVALRGHLAVKRHVEVLLPADDRVVRAAEGCERRAVRKQEGDRGELLLRRAVVLIDIADEPRAAKALAPAQRDEQLPVLLLGIGELAVLLRVQREQRLRRVAKRRALALHTAVQNARERHIRQVAEDQRVDLPEGHLRKRDVSPPLYIVDEVRHMRLLPRRAALFLRILSAHLPSVNRQLSRRRQSDSPKTGAIFGFPDQKPGICAIFRPAFIDRSASLIYTICHIEQLSRFCRAQGRALRTVDPHAEAFHDPYV